MHTRVRELIRSVSLDRGESARVGAWLADHRAEVLAQVRACDRDGSRAMGTQLAAAVWPAARLVPDPDWWSDLAEAGEALAIADRDPFMLIDLLHRSAVTFAGHGDRLSAEASWVRALAIIRRDDRKHRDQGRAVLGALGSLYREWGRLSKALDAYLALVDLLRDAGDPAATAEALAEVGATMHAAGRLTSAMDYFDRADKAMTSSSVAHARILVWCGRTRWEQGQSAAARRRWSQALAMLVDVDDDGAHEVRELLDADHPSFPYWSSNTSSSPSGGVG